MRLCEDLGVQWVREPWDPQASRWCPLRFRCCRKAQGKKRNHRNYITLVSERKGLAESLAEMPTPFTGFSPHCLSSQRSRGPHQSNHQQHALARGGRRKPFLLWVGMCRAFSGVKAAALVPVIDTGRENRVPTSDRQLHWEFLWVVA